VDFGEDEAIIEASVPPDWLDKSLTELALSREKGLTIVALKPQGGPGILPHGDTVLREGDVLVVGGPKKALDSSPLIKPPDR
jgi:Trk K+ transport system NAD-binding subunit